MLKYAVTWRITEILRILILVVGNMKNEFLLENILYVTPGGTRPYKTLPIFPLHEVI